MNGIISFPSVGFQCSLDKWLTAAVRFRGLQNNFVSTLVIFPLPVRWCEKIVSPLIEKYIRLINRWIVWLMCIRYRPFMLYKIFWILFDEKYEKHVLNVLFCLSAKILNFVRPNWCNYACENSDWRWTGHCWPGWVGILKTLSCYEWMPRDLWCRNVAIILVNRGKFWNCQTLMNGNRFNKCWEEF